MDYTLKQLRYFLAVAEHGNVTAASESLYVSQPAISNAINQLEESFGVQLLIRHHAKGVTLTPAGRDLVASASSLLAHAEELNTQTKELNTSLSGTIGLGCFVTLAPLYIPRLLRSFNFLYPDVGFELHEGNIEEMHQALLAGQIELALLYDLGPTERIEKRVLTEAIPQVILPRGHALAKKDKISLMDLQDEPMILFDLPHSREYFQSLFTGYGFKPLIKHRTGNFEFVRSMVANGRGFSILNIKPRSNLCYDGSEVAMRPLAEAVEPLPIVIAHAAGVRLAKRTEVFLEFCQDQYLDEEGL